MTEEKLQRSVSNGGYARGAETRRRIINAAIGLFGQHGFEGASTRDIAAVAGVNAPALQYYFESKEGLYRACAESLAESLWEAFEPAVNRAHAALARHADSESLIDAFISIMEAVADRTFVKQHDIDQRLFFAREQGDGEPQTGSAVLRQRVRKPLHEINVSLLARISGKRINDPLTSVRVLSLYGQLLLFHVSRRATLEALNWREIDVRKARFLKASITDQARILLEHWNRERNTANDA